MSRSIRFSGFFGNVVKLVTGNVLGQGLSILVTPVLTRLFAPEAFGLVAIFTSITGVASIVACLRYDVAIVLPETDGEAVNVFGLGAALVFVFACISSFVVFIAGESIARLLNAPEFERYLWMAPLMILFQGLFTAFSYWVIRRKQFGKLAVATFLQSVATQSVKLALGFGGYVSGGVLIVTAMFGSLVSTGFLGFRIWSYDSALFQREVSFGGMIKYLQRYRRFPLIDTWSTLLNALSWQLPALLLASFFSPAVVGFYALGFNLVKLPMGMIGSAIGQVFFQRASVAHVHGGLTDLVTNVFRRLVAFGLFPLLLLTAIGQELFANVFGAGWSEAGVFVQIISPWLFFVLISSPLSTLFLVLEKQQAMLKFNVVIFVTRLASLLIGGHLGTPRVALLLFSGSGVIVYGALLYYLIHLSHASLRKCSLILFEHGLAGIIGIVVILFAKSIIMSNALLIGLACLLIILYEVRIMLRDPQVKAEIANFLSPLRPKTAA